MSEHEVIGHRDPEEETGERAPRNAEESILLSEPELPEHYTMMAEVSQMDSRARRQVLDRCLGLIADNPEAGAVLLRNITIIGGPENVRNEEVARQTQRFGGKLLEKVNQRQQFSSRSLEHIMRYGPEIYRPDADPEWVGRKPFADMRDRYVHYLLLPEEEQARSLRSDAHGLLTDPEALDKQFELFAAIREAGVLSAGGEVAQEMYAQGLHEAISHVLEREIPPRPTAVGMERWVGRWARGEDPRAEQLLRRMIAETYSPEEITDVLYDISLAGFSSGDPHTMMRTAELLSWSTDLLLPESSQGIDLEFARFSVNGIVRQKALEIRDVAYSYLSITSATQLRQYAANMYKIHGHTEFHKRVARNIIEHPVEMAAMGWDESVMTGGKWIHRIRMARKLLKQSADMMGKIHKGGMPAIYSTHNTEVGPLGEWYRDYYASFSTEIHAAIPWSDDRTVMAHLNFPNRPTPAVTKTTAGRASRTVYEQLQDASFGQVVEARTYWNTLGYLVPANLDRRAWMAIEQRNRLLRDEMIVDKAHSLSPKGDHMEIMNLSVLDLGFKNIDYFMDENQKDLTIVTLRVGNAAFRCVLDRDYVLREYGTMHGLGLSQSAPFLELVLLSHLYQIHCQDPLPGKRKGEGPSGGIGEETGPRVDYRRAHRRILPMGHKPQHDQIIMALDEYGIDLVRQNAERMERGEERLITWVKRVVPPYIVESPNPVYNSGGRASVLIRELLDEVA